MIQFHVRLNVKPFGLFISEVGCARRIVNFVRSFHNGMKARVRVGGLLLDN